MTFYHCYQTRSGVDPAKEPGPELHELTRVHRNQSEKIKKNWSFKISYEKIKKTIHVNIGYRCYK
jgi:hypothetical protein